MPTIRAVIFWSGWTSGAHLMYPVLSCYQMVSPDHAHLLPVNMTALMVGILRVEERGNVHASQAICIGSRSKLQQFSKLTLENTSRLAVLLSLALGCVLSQSENCCSLDLLPMQIA